MQLLSRTATLGPADASFRLRSPERGQSRVHGSGTKARVRMAPALPRLLPPRSLAEGALPQPDRLGHLVSQTRDVAGWSLPRRRAVCPRAHVYESARRCVACAALRLPGPPHASLREEQRDPPHPRCLPSSEEPRPGLVHLLHSLSPACGVMVGRLFNLRAAAALTGLRTRPRTRLRVSVDGHKGRT